MEADQTRLIDSGAQVSSGKHESDWDPPSARPVEDEPFALPEDRPIDRAQPPYIAPLEGVLSRVVQAQVEPGGADLELLQTRLDSRKISRRVPDKVPRRALSGRVAVKGRHGDVKLPDGRVLRHQGVRAAPAMRVEIQDQDGTCPGGAGRVDGQREAVERAEAGSVATPRMVQPTRQRTRDPVRDGGESRRDRPTIRRADHGPKGWVPGKTLRFRQGAG